MGLESHSSRNFMSLPFIPDLFRISRVNSYILLPILNSTVIMLGIVFHALPWLDNSCNANLTRLKYHKTTNEIFFMFIK